MAHNKEDLLCSFCKADIRGARHLLFHVDLCHSHEDPAIKSKFCVGKVSI